MSTILDNKYFNINQQRIILSYYILYIIHFTYSSLSPGAIIVIYPPLSKIESRWFFGGLSSFEHGVTLY